MKNNKNGLVIWLTGLPCSGKTTISKEIEKYFLEKGKSVQILDGDVLRKGINSDLGFSKEDRDENIRRVTHIAKILSNNGINVVVAFVSPYRKMREFAKDVCGENQFIEVQVKCNLDECEKRDVKGMYAKARKGELKKFTGIDDAYEESLDPDVIVETDKYDLEDCLEKIVDFIENIKE